MRGGASGVEFLGIVEEDVPGLIFIVVVDLLRGFDDDGAFSFGFDGLHHSLPLLVGLSQLFSPAFADHLPVVSHD